MIWAALVFLYLVIGFIIAMTYGLLGGKLNLESYYKIVFNWPSRDEELKFIWESLWRK